jgi:hypothetical protein
MIYGYFFNTNLNKNSAAIVGKQVQDFGFLKNNFTIFIFMSLFLYLPFLFYGL